jgi:tight adherence protein C
VFDSLTRMIPRSWLANDMYLVAGFVFVVLCAIGIYMTFRPRDNVSNRVRIIQERHRAMLSQTTIPKKRNKKPEASVNFIRKVVNSLQLIQKNQIGKTEALLVEGGFRSKDAIYVLAFFNLILPILLGIVGFFIMKTFAISPKSRWHNFNYIWPVLGAYIGLKLPMWYVARARKKRYHQIRKSLPDLLDLMTICAEAGLSLAASLDRVAKELILAYPEISEELTITSLEMGILPDRNKALSNWAERCKLPEVRGIVGVLIQTEKYGTPIAQALRVLSTEFRQTRMLNAEQKAARLPALMTVPMIVFILPTLFIVIISPAIIKLLKTLSDNPL